jgi:AcrR family transcriptional regulator
MTDAMSRTTYHHGNLRQALVDAAVALTRSDGLGAVTIRELARSLAVSPAAAYRHFPDRDALLAEVGRRGREELTNRMLDAVDQVSRPDDTARSVDRFLAVGRAYLAFSRDEPNLLSAAFHPVDVAPDPSEDPSPWSVLTGALDELHRIGALDEERRAGAEVFAWSAVHGFGTLRTSGAFRSAQQHDPEEEALLQGIARALGLDA